MIFYCLKKEPQTNKQRITKRLTIQPTEKDKKLKQRNKETKQNNIQIIIILFLFMGFRTLIIVGLNFLISFLRFLLNLQIILTALFDHCTEWSYVLCCAKIQPDMAPFSLISQRHLSSEHGQIQQPNMLAYGRFF